MKRLLSIFIFLVVAISAIARDRICDMGMARKWCDETMLHRVEGIWEDIGDETYFLICRSELQDNLYDIIVVESPDTRLTPGDCVGMLKSSPVSTKFEMGLYRTKKKGIFADLGKCLAVLNEKEDALLVSNRKVKISIGARYLFPSFWRILRVKTIDPLESLPKGLVRIYPKQVNREPDYL